MSYYAGLDVSLEETAICVVDGDGTIVKELRAESAPDALLSGRLACRFYFRAQISLFAFRVNIALRNPPFYFHDAKTDREYSGGPF